jgi:hypothetical protein
MKNTLIDFRVVFNLKPIPSGNFYSKSFRFGQDYRDGLDCRF